MNIKLLSAAALAFCIGSVSIRAQVVTNVTGAKITEVGLYKAHVVAQANAQSGWRSDGVNEVSWVKSTTNVPARAGLQFGFRYEIKGDPTNAPLMVQVVHEQPQPKDPKTGETVARSVTEIQSKIGQSYLLYTLENEDLIPGKWKFQILYQGKKLCEQGFMVGMPVYQYRVTPTNSANATNR